MKKEIAVYIHIPFCKQICPYCDFCKVFYEKGLVEKYLKALEEEIIETYQKEKVKTIYIGGGTPSHLTCLELERLFQILTLFQKKDSIEYTVECNPEDLCEEKLLLFKKYGINRISIGIETTIEKFQKKIKRVISKEEIRKKVELVKKVGFSNINVDLIYAFQGETEEDLQEDLNFLMSLNVPHISLYSLQIEKHTQFGYQKEKKIDPSLDRDLYDFLCNFLEEKGYQHYEISNFAKKGFFSSHNLVYWNNQEYYGFGAGASFYKDGIRGHHTRSVYQYIQEKKVIEEEKLGEEEKMDYFLLLGLRKEEGIGKREFFFRYQKKLKEVYSFDSYLKQGVLEEEGDFIRIAKEYRYVMNTILVTLLNSRKSS